LALAGAFAGGSAQTADLPSRNSVPTYLAPLTTLQFLLIPKNLM
jgi:hypothetical protein